MASIGLAPFLPDVASIDAAACAVATNVIARADGYAPVRAPVPITLALPENCRGVASVQSPAYGYVTYFAGTANKLYRLNLANYGWIDASPLNTQIGLQEGDYWSFSLYGDRLVATPQNGPTLVIHVDSGKRFAPLAGGPPRARFNGVVGEFLVLASLGANRNALQWSDLGDIERWTPGFQGQLGDVQILPDGGAITGFAGGEFGLVFQERAIRRMIFNPGSRAVFDVSVAEQNRGCVSPSALVTVGSQTFFVDRDGFYVISGGASSPIGAERVNRFFVDRVSPSALPSTLAIRDNTGSRVLFAYRSKDAPSDDRLLLDEGLLYDWRLDRWTFLNLPIRYGLPVAKPGTSIDALTGNTDELTLSFDDPSYLGGDPGFGVVTADNRVGSLTGLPLEATMETAEAMLSRPNRSFVRGVRLDGDADDWRAAIGSRESLKRNEAIRLRDESAPNREGFAPTRASGRYHRVRLRIPAGVDWTYAKGIEPDAVPEGMR